MTQKAKPDKNDLAKARQQIELLESELKAIKFSRSYRAAKVASIVNQKLRHNPKGTIIKVVKLGMTNPKKLANILKGRDTSSHIYSIVNNDIRNYHDWIILNEPDEDELDKQKKDSDAFAYKPLFSIITPVFNPPIYALKELIDSVVNQTYPYFELCLGDFGDSDEVKQLLSKYQNFDSRIKVYSFKDNKGIAENSNSLLGKASGEFIALLDHDDTISRNALYENAALLNQGAYDFIYSDKDKIDESSQRFEPIFKPEWSPDILLNVNYLTHLNVMRTSIVLGIKGWDPKTDGAQDWDLFLRIIQKTDRIAHIPKVLYHWRIIKTSTAFSIETKPYALEGQRNALNKYLSTQKIAAHTYHGGKSELLLRWDEEAIDPQPTIVLLAATHSDLVRTISFVKRSLGSRRYKIIIVHDYHVAQEQKNLFKDCQGWIEDSRTFSLDTLQKINRIVKKDHTTKTVLFFNCSLQHIHAEQKDWFADLTGWLSINGLGAVGGKILDSQNLIMDGAGIITPDGVKALFSGYSSYYGGLLGNTEWIRDLLWISSQLFAVRKETLNFIDGIKDPKAKKGLPYLFSGIYSHGLRLVFNPKITAVNARPDNKDFDLSIYSENANLWSPAVGREGKDIFDPYSNPNVDLNDPMKLKAVYYANTEEDLSFDLQDKYSEEAIISSRTFNLNSDDISYNRANSWRPHEDNKPFTTVGWFLPRFDGIYAGLNNIFNFAQYLQDNKQLKTTFFILKDGPIDTERELVIKLFPSLAKAKFVGINSIEIDSSQKPPLDIGICTLWSTAYVLAKYKEIKRRCYFIQDNEVNFYPKGTVSSLVELTYKLNYFAIANTAGLLENYKKKYQGKGEVLLSKVDLAAYSGTSVRKDPKLPYKVFFYGRPLMPRNAFELGISALIELKNRLGDNLQVFSAGADWDPNRFGVGGIVDNLGKLPYDALPKFYRGMDAGLMFMFSGHPGVVASELMASGCPVVVNEYEDLTWNNLYQNEKTCLISLPTASIVADNLERCLKDTSLREKIIPAARKNVVEFYKNYDKTCEEVAAKIVNN